MVVNDPSIKPHMYILYIYIYIYMYIYPSSRFGSQTELAFGRKDFKWEKTHPFSVPPYC